MKIVDRLFIRLLTRLTLSRTTRHSDIAADLAAAHGADLAGVLADIDRLRRLLDVRVERVRVFVDDYSTDVPNLPQAEHLAMSLDEAAHEWSTVRLKGISGRYDRMADADTEIANLKVQLDAANKKIKLLRDDYAARANGGSANAEELERFHAWALKLSGLPSKNPSHEAVRTTVSRNHELMLAAHNELTAKSAEQTRKLKQWEHDSEQLPAQPAETQQTICKWAFEIFGECTPERAAIRAGEEMGEFMAVLGPRGVHEFGRRGALTDEQNAQLMKEAADVVVCLYRVADLLGADLHEEIDRVMKINRGRQWVRDGKGCGYHVKSPTTGLPSIREQVPGAALYRYGDVAQALGKTTQEMVDAVAEATTGSFENVRKVAGFAAQTPYAQQEISDALVDFELKQPIGEPVTYADGVVGQAYAVGESFIPRAERYTKSEIRQLVSDERNGDPEAHAKLEKILARERESVESGAAGGFTPPTEPAQPGPAFFDDEMETLPASELAALKQRLENAERWEGRLRDGLERVLRALFGAEAAAHAVGDIGTESFEAVMVAVREKAEHAKSWCIEGGDMPLEESRLKGSAVKTNDKGWPIT